MLRGMTALLIVFSAVPALACPNLTGHYTCANDDGTSEPLTITQSTVNGVVQYMINGSELWMDNQPHGIDGDNSFRNASMRAWCEDDSLKYEVTGHYFDGEKEVGKLDVVSELKVNGDQFSQTDTGSMKSVTYEIPISNQVLCARDKSN